MSATNISNLLLQNINELLPVEIQLDKALTRREIDLRVRKCDKLKGKSISKTLTMGRLFKHERFLSRDCVYTAFNLLYFHVNAQCKASMRKDNEMFKFNYVRGQVRCTKEHVHALQ